MDGSSMEDDEEEEEKEEEEEGDDDHDDDDDDEEEEEEEEEEEDMDSESMQDALEETQKHLEELLENRERLARTRRIAVEAVEAPDRSAKPVGPVAEGLCLETVLSVSFAGYTKRSDHIQGAFAVHVNATESLNARDRLG
ncbi:MAG: hypothetical protein KC668_30935, partial [Myxococcales bacterium]|nr:hypothetical protein [Myxococcales bacterium]